MPYKKGYKKPYRSSYKGYKKKSIYTLDNASKALAVAYSIKRLMNVEFKYHDVQLTAVPVNTTPSKLQLSNIPQGDTDITRDGAQVKLVSMDLKYKITVNGNAADESVRVMIILDKQTNGAIYTASDVLADITGNDNIVSMLNLNNKYRFRVLYNKVHSLSNSSPRVIYKEVHKTLSLKLRFESSTPSIADLNSNSLSILYVGTHDTNTSLLILYSRLRYVDN